MGQDVYRFRIACILGGLILAFAALGHHLYHLQIVRHTELYEKARAKYTSSRTSRGQRGSIYDVRGNLLAGNISGRDLLAEPRRMGERRAAVIDELVHRLGVKRAVLEQRFESGRVEVVVKRGISLESAAALEALALPGVRFVDSQRRFYPKHELLANVLGFTDNNHNGVYGLEATFDRELSPQQDVATYERDRRGRALHRASPQVPHRLDGNSIHLTIDEPIQDTLEAELRILHDSFSPRYTYAIMANPRTGAIMAMGQLPSYDPNDRTNMNADRWRNHIVSDVYDPGSTMKCIAIAGAVDYGTVTMDSVIDCEGGYWHYGGRPLRDTHGHGMLTVSDVIQKSSNIGTAKIALAMGEQGLYQTLRRFGFGERTGLELTHESPGILRPLDQWDRLSITRFPIGQGVSVTPLQMVQAYCALANRGQMIQLRLAEYVTDPDGNVMTRFEPRSRGWAARPRAVAAVVEAMKRVTETGGTARRAAVDGYDVAGKTGTSQKLIDGSYSGHDKYIASFIGFAPADDPAFVLLVVADEPNGAYYGGTVCGPTFRRIAEQTLRYLHVAPTHREQI